MPIALASILALVPPSLLAVSLTRLALVKPPPGR
jgi:hypothetical protein